MRMLIFLPCLLLMLTGCAAPDQVIQEQHRPGTMARPSFAHPTTVSSLGERTAMPLVVHPSATPTAEASLLLRVHNAQENRDEIHLIDPVNGHDLPGYPPFVGAPYPLSADGTHLAVIESHGQSCEPSGAGSACYRSADVLHLIDLRSWREVTATLSTKGWNGPGTFSPDSRHFSLVINAPKFSALMLFDTSTGQAITQRVLPFRPALMRYSQDSGQLALYGQPLSAYPGITRPDPPRVLLVDATTLDVVWEQPLARIISGSWCLESCKASHTDQRFASWTPAVVFSNDGRKLYIVHAETEQLTTVDFVAQSVDSVEIRSAQSWFEQLFDRTAVVAEAKGGANGAFKTAVLSPDGAKLYLLGETYSATRDSRGDWQRTEDVLGLHVIDVERGYKLARYDTEVRWGIRISPDGAFVFLTTSDGSKWSTEVIDTKHVQLVTRLDAWEVVPTRQIDGQTIFVASQRSGQLSNMAVLDPRSFAVIHSWSVNNDASWLPLQ